MSRRLPESSEERVSGGGVRAVYVDAFASHGIKLRFTKGASERIRQK